MHDSRKTVPTFLIYGAGVVFLFGIGWIWFLQPFSGLISQTLGPFALTSIVAITSCLATLGMQWLLIRLWRSWMTPKTPVAEGEPIRLTPDKRDRIQTGQA